MTFILLIFLAALSLEGIGTLISIMGLTLLFGVNTYIISLAVAFDFAKIIAVSFLYKEWQNINLLLKLYLTAAAIVLVTITSTGAAGFLSTEFQKAILPSKSLEVRAAALTEEKQKLELRKKDIDAQIANLPADTVRGRTKLLNSFKEELDHVNHRVIELDTELPKVQVELIERTSHAGPITYLAQAFDSTPEKSMRWIIGLIIFVFDPLAVSLILAGNYMLEKKKKQEPVIIEEKAVEPMEDVEDLVDLVPNGYWADLMDNMETWPKSEEPDITFDDYETDDNEKLEHIVEAKEEPVNISITESLSVGSPMKAPAPEPVAISSLSDIQSVHGAEVTFEDVSSQNLKRYTIDR